MINSQVRTKAKEMLILNGAIDFALNTLKRFKTTPMDPARASILATCKLPSVFKMGQSDSEQEDEKTLIVPLANNDPFNLTYLGSEKYRKLSARYGLQEKRISPLPQSVFKIIEDKSISLKKPSTETFLKYNWLLALDCTTILHECMKRSPSLAQEMVENLLTMVESTINENQSNEEGEDSSDLEMCTHNIDVLSNLLLALDGLSDKILAYSFRIKDFIMACLVLSASIRKTLFAELEDAFFFFNDQIDIPIVSAEQYNAFIEMDAIRQEATNEIVKSGRIDKLTEIEENRNAMNEIMDYKSEQLRKLTIFALYALSGYGIFYAMSTGAPEASIVAAYSFIVELLDNEHRGLRIACVEALVLVAKVQLDNQQNRTQLNDQVQASVSLFIKKLKDEYKTLYRRV